MDGLGNNICAEAIESGLLFINVENILFVVCLDVPVHVNNILRLLEYIFDVPCYLDLTVEVWSVNLGDQGAQNRRSRRYLHHLRPGIPLHADGLNTRPDPLGDVMTLGLSVILRDEVDLNVGLIAPGPEEVMAYQAVEVKRRRRANIQLVIESPRARS